MKQFIRNATPRAKNTLIIVVCGILVIFCTPAKAERLCVDSASTSASGALTDSGGSASSYANNETCGFTIQAGAGQNVTLSFSSFAYERNYDYLRIYDGTSTTDTLLGNFTGSSLPADVTATSGNMLIVSDTDFSVVAAGFRASWSTSVGPLCPAQSVGDNFPRISYAQNSGSQNWSGDWQEIGESDGPSSGQARVNSSNCSGGQCLRIGEPSGVVSWTGRGASRQVDLSVATSATLTFNYRTGYATGALRVDLQVSDDGGSTWDTLQSYVVNSTSFTAVPQSFDITAYIASDTQIRFISDGRLTRSGLYVDDLNISYDVICLPTALAEWRFDEASWSGGVAGVVEDQVGGVLDGTPIGGVNTIAAGQICRAGDFDGSDDYINVAGIENHLSGTASLSFWIETTQVGNNIPWRAPGVSGIEEAGGIDDVFWGFVSASGRIGIATGDDPPSISTTQINNGQWHHVVVTRDAPSGDLKTYVNGSLQASIGAPSGIIGNAFSSLGRIENTGGTPEYFQGNLDEVIIFADVLTDAEVQLIYANQSAGDNWDGTARSCPVANVTYLLVEHDGYGIHCAAETITVSAMDGSNTLFSSYAQEITLDTQTGSGSWSLLSGSGSLTDATPNDGLATYQFVIADGGDAVFALSYLEGVASMDIDAWQTSDSGIADDDSEGVLIFAPSGFTVTASALSNPPPNPINDAIATHRAGTDFVLHIAAFGTTPTDSICGVIESYQGAKLLKFWLDRADPNSGTISAAVNNVSIASSAGAAANQSVLFVAGQASVTAKYKDSGSVAVQVSDDTSFSTVLTGATNNFVVQPDYLEVTAVTSIGLTPNPAASTMTEAGFVASGEPFRAVVTARDAEGDPTPNFGLESSSESVRIFSDALIAPVGGRNGSSGDVVGGAAFTRTSAATFTNTSVVFDEVGIIRLRAQVADNNFLNTGPLNNPASGNIGRFYPHHYDMVSDTAVGACNNFTYAGQDDLVLAVDIEAQNAVNVIVENYDLSLIGASGVASIRWVAENNNTGLDLGARLTINPAVWSAGRYTLNDLGVEFGRLASPDGPFQNLQVGVRVDDILDNGSLTALNMQPSTAGDCAVSATCDAQTVGGETVIAYGRVTLGAGMSPEFENLDLPIRAEYWDGSGFRLNSLDDCTTYELADMSLSVFLGNLTVGETLPIQPVVSQSFVNGVPNISVPFLISAPGLGNDGSVLVEVNVPAWLEFDWLGGGDEEPRERQTFGHYRGHDSVVYWDEVTRQ